MLAADGRDAGSARPAAGGRWADPGLEGDGGARSTHRMAITVLGAVTAGAAAAIALSSGAGVAASATLSGSQAGAYAGVQPGPAITASTVAFILPADSTPATSPSPSASSADPSPSADPTATATPDPSGTPTATSSPDPSATPTATSSPDPSSTPTATSSPTPSADASAAPSASSSPTKRAAPAPKTSHSVLPSTSVLPLAQVLEAQPLPTQPSLAPTPAASGSKAPVPVQSATASSASEPRIAEPPSRAAAGLAADGGPSPTTFAVVVAALGALAGCSFAIVRRQRAYPRRVPKHSRRASRRSWLWPTRN
jgi:hypothetical protein